MIVLVRTSNESCCAFTPSKILYSYTMLVSLSSFQVVGILWCKRGFDWLKVAAQTEGPSGEKQAVTAVPSAEMV